jgi:hypothetical protein
MDLLERLSAKQLIFIILILGFLFYNLESKSLVYDFFKSIKHRFDIKSQFSEIGTDLNSKENNTVVDDTNKNKVNNINELREKNYKKSELSDEDEFCNKKRGKRSTQIEEMFQCLLNNTPMTKDIMIPQNTIPYNFDNKKDNNVLYSINKDYTYNKLNYEKKLSGGVVALNNKLLHTNFDKDIDYYKIGRRRDTILNLEKNQLLCNINNLVKFPKEIKIFTRRIENKVLTNWNIPILPFGYFPKEIVFVLSKIGDLNKKRYSKYGDYYTIPFSKKPCEYEHADFKIRSNILGDRIFYSFSSEIDNWFNKKHNCYKLSARVYFFFNYYDNNKVLKECVMESNVSNLF